MKISIDLPVIPVQLPGGNSGVPKNSVDLRAETNSDGSVYVVTVRIFDRATGKIVDAECSLNDLGSALRSISAASRMPTGDF